MRRAYYLLFLVLFFADCKPARKVNTSFYYWKTVYRQNTTENEYLQHLHTRNMYVRIMDVDLDESGNNPVPVSPVIFQNKLPDTVAIIPVVFIVDKVLQNLNDRQLVGLAQNIARFVDAKVAQAGKSSYSELQIDCDWTTATRNNYFTLLRLIKPLLHHKTLSATLRLHQLKNLKSNGIPPVNKVMLMCYNMGNLRKYGGQNSIMELSELKKYAGENLSSYPLPMDIGLPLFSWAVAFRDKTYIGIARQINFATLTDSTKFIHCIANVYKAKTDLPALGLQQGDEIRWENVTMDNLSAVTQYLSRYIKADSLNLIWFHLDEPVLKNYTYDELEKISYLLH